MSEKSLKLQNISPLLAELDVQVAFRTPCWKSINFQSAELRGKTATAVLLVSSSALESNSGGGCRLISCATSTCVMSFLSRFLVRNASFTRWSVLKNIEFRGTSSCCLHRSGSIYCAPTTDVKLKFKCPVKCYSTGEKTRKKNFYKVLGVSPKATQAQIKNAFYKLSITHHPDKHKGSEESHENFQHISEAYNVLSNQETRKQYDRELIIEGQLRAEHTHAYKPPPSFKKNPGSIYNFDEWTKAHYSNQLDRNQRTRIRREELKEEKSSIAKIRTGTLRKTFFLITVAISTIMYIYLSRRTTQILESTED